jgi:hypothetical protein
MAAVYVRIIPYTIAWTSPVASCLLLPNCKLQHKFPQHTPTAFDNHPPSKRASSLRIVWLHYFFHIEWMNYAPNGTIIKTKHVCHKVWHFVSCWVYDCNSLLLWFICYRRIFQFVPSGNLVASSTRFCNLRSCFYTIWALVLLVSVLLPSYNCIHSEQFHVPSWHPRIKFWMYWWYDHRDMEVIPLTQLLPMLIANVTIDKVLIWFWDEMKNHTHKKSRTFCQLR